MASRAHASLTLWKAILASKDAQCLRHCLWTTSGWLESVDVFGVPAGSQFHQTRTYSVAVGKRSVLSVFNGVCEQVTKCTEHPKQPSVNLFTPARARDSIFGRHFARSISSEVSKQIAQDEDAGHDGGVNEHDDGPVNDEDVNEHEGESATGYSPEVGKRAEVDDLFVRLANCARAGTTVAEIELYIKEGNNFSKEHAVILVTKLKRYRSYAQAAEVLEWIAKTEMLPWTEHDQAALLTMKGKLGQSTAVEKIFNDSPPELKTELTYNAVIKHFCERGMVKKANEWMALLIKSGLITKCYIFNRLLRMYKDRDMGRRADEVLQSMEENGIWKDVYTYSTLMAIKGKKNDVAGVEKIFEECKADPKVKLESAVYVTLAGSYIDAGMTEKAAAALDEGERLVHDRRGNVDEVIATMWGKLGNKERVLRLWETMKGREIVAARTYVVMVELFGRLGMVDEAEALFHEMQKTKGRVRPRQFTALLSAYANSNLLDKAEALVSDLDAMELKRSATINHHLVVSYLKMQRMDEALRVVDEARGKGKFPLWFATMVIVLDAVAEKGNVVAAEKIFGHLMLTFKEKSLKPYNFLLKAYVKAGIPAEGVIQRMTAAGIRSNKETSELLKRAVKGSTVSDTSVEKPLTSDATLVS